MVGNNSEGQVEFGDRFSEKDELNKFFSVIVKSLPLQRVGWPTTKLYSS